MSNSTTSSLTHHAVLEVEADGEFNAGGDPGHYPIEVLAHRENGWRREAKVKHLGPIPYGGRRVYWTDAEDITVEAVAR